MVSYDVIKNVANGLCTCKTSGTSTWGTLAVACLPFFIPDTPLPSGNTLSGGSYSITGGSSSGSAGGYAGSGATYAGSTGGYSGSGSTYAGSAGGASGSGGSSSGSSGGYSGSTGGSGSGATYGSGGSSSGSTKGSSGSSGGSSSSTGGYGSSGSSSGSTGGSGSGGSASGSNGGSASGGSASGSKGSSGSGGNASGSNSGSASGGSSSGSTGASGSGATNGSGGSSSGSFGGSSGSGAPYGSGGNSSLSGGNSSVSGTAPWGNKTTTNTDPYTGAPNTGQTRSYDFVLSRGQLAPDGYLRDVILVNGGFPGPLIEANWGDKISVNVFNNISGEDEGTSLHWHGFLQTGTPEMDGVPGVTQCPIAPGKSFTYEFTAEVYGSSWYHSHYSAQYSGGAVGPIVVHGPTNVNYDIDIGPVMLSDWYHKKQEDIIDAMLQPGNGAEALDVPSDNNLINGRGNFDCSTVAAGDNTPCVSNAGVAKFNFTKGKTHRLRLVHSGSAGVQRFSIDSHTMTVIANDFVPIKPYNTTVVTLGVGQRSDVLVTANAGGNSSAFWMRSNSTCGPSNQPYALAAIYYDGANTNLAPTSSAWNVPASTSCANDALTLTQPEYAMNVTTPDFTQNMGIGLTVNGTNVTVLTFNNVSAKVDYNSPILESTVAGNLTFPESANVLNFAENNTIRVVVSNPSPLAHPMHLHGHNFQVLNFGSGTTWDGTIINAGNPQRRDTALVDAGGYLVIQFTANPGSWAWHCHIAWHASAGFFSVLNVGVHEVEKMVLPASIGQTCTDWSAYTSQYVVDDTDSGV